MIQIQSQIKVVSFLKDLLLLFELHDLIGVFDSSLDRDAELFLSQLSDRAYLDVHLEEIELLI